MMTGKNWAKLDFQAGKFSFNLSVSFSLHVSQQSSTPDFIIVIFSCVTILCPEIKHEQ